MFHPDESQHAPRAVGQSITLNHSRAVSRALTNNHSRAVAIAPRG